jgi:hypothetical protein
LEHKKEFLFENIKLPQGFFLHILMQITLLTKFSPSFSRDDELHISLWGGNARAFNNDDIYII